VLDRRIQDVVNRRRYNGARTIEAGGAGCAMSSTWISSSAELLAVVHEMMRVGLPSGQQVARAMRVSVLSNATLGLSNDPGWGGEAPLWFCILKEAELPPYLGPTKTHAERTVRLPRFLREELAASLAERTLDPQAFVFTAPKGGQLRHNNFYQRLFCPALARAGLPAQVRFHDLRHTCAALLIAQGAHPKAIQVHLGHSSIQVTMDRYGHLFPDALEHLADRLDAARTQARTDPARIEPRERLIELSQRRVRNGP
jgi:hypothetical protein